MSLIVLFDELMHLPGCSYQFLVNLVAAKIRSGKTIDSRRKRQAGIRARGVALALDTHREGEIKQVWKQKKKRVALQERR
jgi:hypothetical protein